MIMFSIRIVNLQYQYPPTGGTARKPSMWTATLPESWGGGGGGPPAPPMGTVMGNLALPNGRWSAQKAHAGRLKDQFYHFFCPKGPCGMTYW